MPKSLSFIQSNSRGEPPEKKVTAQGHSVKSLESFPFLPTSTLRVKKGGSTSSMSHKFQKRWTKVIRQPEVYSSAKKHKLSRWIYKGIPSSFRGCVWLILLKHSLGPGKTPIIKSALKGRSSHAEQILKDVVRTPSRNKNDSYARKEQQMLSNVLNAYSIIDSKIGYTQGMNEVASFLIHFMIEQDALACLLALTFGSNHRLRGLYSNGFPLLNHLNYILIAQLASRLPALADHFDSLGYDIRIQSTRWFICLFVQSVWSDCLFSYRLSWLLGFGTLLFSKGPSRLLLQPSAF